MSAENKAFPKFDKESDLSAQLDRSGLSGLEEPDETFHMRSKRHSQASHYSKMTGKSRKMSKHSRMRKVSVNSGIAVNLSRRISMASAVSRVFKEKLEKRKRLESRESIDPDYNEEDLENEPEVKLSKSMIYLLLFFMMFLNFGNYYVFDFPQLFEGQLLSKFEITALQVSYLYAIYSIPNFVFAPLISILLNYTGLGFGSIMLSFLVFLSSFLMFFATKYNSFLLMLLARAIFGIGGESLVVAQAAMAEKWFTGKFLSLAIGLNNVFALMGAALAAWLGPEIFVEKRDLQWVIFVMCVICFAAWVFNVGYWIVEEKLIKQEDDQNENIEHELMLKRQATMRGDDFTMNESSKMNSVVWSKSTADKKEVKFTFKHVNHFGKLFWCLTLVFAFISMSYFQFTNFVTDFLMQRFKYSYLDAKNLVALIPIATIIFIPILSSIIVLVGMKGIALVISSLVACFIYWYMGTMPAEPSFNVTLCIIGVAFFYSLYSSVIWSSMTLVVPQ